MIIIIIITEVLSYPYLLPCRPRPINPSWSVLPLLIVSFSEHEHHPTFSFLSSPWDHFGFELVVEHCRVRATNWHGKHENVFCYRTARKSIEKREGVLGQEIVYVRGKRWN